MTATAILLIFIGVVIAINTPNLVGVVQGNKTFTATSTSTATTATTSTDTGSGGVKVQ